MSAICITKYMSKHLSSCTQKKRLDLAQKQTRLALWLTLYAKPLIYLTRTSPNARNVPIPWLSFCLSLIHMPHCLIHMLHKPHCIKPDTWLHEALLMQICITRPSSDTPVHFLISSKELSMHASVGIEKMLTKLRIKIT